MHPPFTAEQFFDVFRRYNEAVWPAQIGLIAVGLFTALAAYRANARHSWRWAQVAIVLLAALWLWSGIVYHKMFFASITPAGQVFGSVFIAQAGLLLISMFANGSTFEPTSRTKSITRRQTTGSPRAIFSPSPTTSMRPNARPYPASAVAPASSTGCCAQAASMNAALSTTNRLIIQ